MSSETMKKVFSRFSDYFDQIDKSSFHVNAVILPLCISDDGKKQCRIIRRGRLPEFKPHIRRIGKEWVSLYTDSTPENLVIAAWEFQKKLNAYKSEILENE